jgi:hypothetical protein
MPKQAPEQPPSTSPEDVLEWLRDVVAEGARRVELRAPLSDAPVRVARFGDNDMPADKLEAAAQKLHKAAAVDARTHGRALVMYSLLALGSDGSVVGSFRLGIGGVERTADEDAATLGGVGLQSILSTVGKLNENLARLMMTRFQQVETGSLELVAVLQKQLQEERAHSAAKDKQLNDSAEQRLAWYQKLEELNNQALEREMERKRAEGKERRQDELVEQLKTYLPLGLNRLFGGGKGKGGPLGNEMMMRFLASLKPEQIEAFTSSSALEPEQTVMLAELFVSFGKEYERKLAGDKRRALAAKSETDNGVAAAETEAPPRAPAS